MNAPSDPLTSYLSTTVFDQRHEKKVAKLKHHIPDLHIFYSFLMALIAAGGGWILYVLFAVIEVVLTLLVLWNAWRWPNRLTSAG